MDNEENKEVLENAEVLENTESTELEQADNEVVEQETSHVTTKTEDGYKIDLTKINKEKQDAIREENNVEENNVEENDAQEKDSTEEQTNEKILEEITDEVVEPVKEETKETVTEEVKEVQKVQENNIDLPENIQKVVEFMNETGGTLDDYVRLNADYSNVDGDTLLREYYKQTKSHLSDEEINFLIEDKFSFDEEFDEDRDIRRKKLARKEAVADAQKFLNSLKEKYYEEVKLGSKLSPEQKEAVEFYNQYNEQTKKSEELMSRQKEHFDKVTNGLFNEQFKGFEFKVGEKKYRYNVKDVDSVKQTQSDLLNVFSEYIKDNMLSDAKGYHKALFAASNPDGLANHFYEQGKADAIRQMTSEAKNINVDGRKSDTGVINANGTKVRVVDGESSSKLKIKLKNY